MEKLEPPQAFSFDGAMYLILLKTMTQTLYLAATENDTKARVIK